MAIAGGGLIRRLCWTEMWKPSIQIIGPFCIATEQYGLKRPGCEGRNSPPGSSLERQFYDLGGIMKTTRLSISLAALLCSTALSVPMDRAQAKEGDAGYAPEEIVVTAQRRAERLIDVPASVTALSAATLESASIASTFDLAQVTPGLQVSNTGTFTSFSLRGVSSDTSGPGADNNVAVYLDDMYLPSKSAGVFDFPDVESIEVLKGPQGTLYGRNATGGAILFRTAAPSFSPTGRLSAGYGMYNEREFKAYLSTGLVPDVVAGSLSAYYKKDDGYLNNLLTGKKEGGVETWVMRGKFLVVPSDNVKVTMAGYYSSRMDYNTLNYSLLFGNSNGVSVNRNAILPGFGQVASNSKHFVRQKTYGLSARADIDTGIGAVSVITGYTNLKSRVWTDGDSTSATATDFLTVIPQQTFSAEVNLASRKFGSFSFLTGANYLTDTGYFNPTRVYFGGAQILEIFAKVRTKAFAAYVDGTYALTDKLQATAGLRWTTERKWHYGANNNSSYPYLGTKRWSSATPRASLRYSFNDDTNVYMSYSRGFKSGLFNAVAFTPPSQTVKPETVDAFEAGVKARVSEEFSINASAYYYDYKDIQVTTFQGVTQVLQNAAKARIYGADFDLTYRPKPDLIFTFGISPLNTKYKNYPGAVVIAPIPTASCPVGFTYCGNRNVNVDLTGNQLSRAPKLTSTLSVSYTIHPGNQSVNFFANLYYTEKFYWDASNRIAQGAYALVNGRITWNIDNGPLSIEFWGRNLTDKKYYASSGINSSRDGFVSARPRTVGGTLRAAF
jgi:iron complex outermembrane receptor protein